MATSSEMLTMRQVAEQTGVPQRTLSHWASRGWIEFTEPPPPARGRLVSAKELEKIRAMRDQHGAAAARLAQQTGYAAGNEETPEPAIGEQLAATRARAECLAEERDRLLAEVGFLRGHIDERTKELAMALDGQRELRLMTAQVTRTLESYQEQARALPPPRPTTAWERLAGLLGLRHTP